jgi:hypothetical protein
MIKITNDNISNPYFKEIGSVIYNYPAHVMNPSRIEKEFSFDKKAIGYKVINTHRNRSVINLISCEDTYGMGKSYLNILLADLLSGFWWYDESNDIFSQMEELMDNLLCELPINSDFT